MGEYLLHSIVLSFVVHHRAETKEKFHKVNILHIFFVIVIFVSLFVFKEKGYLSDTDAHWVQKLKANLLSWVIIRFKD